MCSTRDRQRAIVLAAVKDKPFGWPRKARPSLTATRHDGAVELRSGRKNGSAGVKQKNGCESRFRAKILSSRYARAAINFPGTKNRNTRGFSHQTPWSCLRAAALCPSSRYPYGGMAYANPDAVTQIANGLSTTTFTYDNNGNVTQKTVDGTSPG